MNEIGRKIVIERDENHPKTDLIPIIFSRQTFHGYLIAIVFVQASEMELFVSLT
jgi:hypothetical protein